jgi:hypothetical protein
MRTLGSLAAMVVLLSRASAGQVIFNNGLPDNVNAYPVNGYRMADDFALGTGAVITGFEWFAIRYNITGSPTTISGDFDWRIHQDLAGTPGTVVASGAVINGVGTTTPYHCCGGVGPNFGFDAYAFNVAIADVPVTAGTYCLDIGNYVDHSGSFYSQFYWSTSDAASGNAVYLLSDMTLYGLANADLAFDVRGRSADDVMTTPEPGGAVLFLTGLACIPVYRRKTFTRVTKSG